MGTFFRVEVFSENQTQTEHVVELTFIEARRIENLLSKFNDNSEVSILNREAGIQPVKVSPELFNLINISLRYTDLTTGMFDLTTTKLTEWWTEVSKTGILPETKKVNDVLSRVGSKFIRLNPNLGTVQFGNDFITLDFGAIGKGYAIDRMVEILKDNGIDRALIDSGGQVYILGGSVDNEVSSIGIVNPNDTEKMVAVVKLKDQSIATSGSYERFFTIADKRYSHIINPQTGYPADNGILSVSIIAPTAVESDVLSTAVFLMSPVQGMDFIQRNKVEGIIITGDEHRGITGINVSSGLKNQIEIIN